MISERNLPIVRYMHIRLIFSSLSCNILDILSTTKV